MSDWDVTLDGADYMVVPGSYRAGHDGIVDSRLGRVRVGDFSAGQGHGRTVRGAGGDRGGLHSGLGAFPAPWPMTMDAVGAHPARQSISGGFHNDNGGRWGVAGDTYLFVMVQQRVYRWDRIFANAPVQRSATGATISGACGWNGKVYLCYDGSADVKTWDDGAGTLTGSALGAGSKAYGGLIAYGGGVWGPSNSTKTQVKSYCDGAGTQVLTFYLQGKWLNWTTGPDALYIATDTGLMRVTGQWNGGGAAQTLHAESWGSIAPYQSASDDYAWMTVFQGRIYTWAGKTVVYYDSASDRWRHAGLEGSQTDGAAVVNNVLYVSCSPPGDTAAYELWAFTGSGWWRITSTATRDLAYPMASGDGQLVVHQPGSVNAKAYDLEDRYTPAALISPWEIVTPALDAQEPDRQKRWRRVGVETLRNDGQAVGSWSVAVATSVDAGQSWTSAGSPETVSDEVETVDFPLAVTGNQLMVKVTVTSSSGLPPQVIAIWAEYELLNESVRRRRWQFRVHARARGVNRAGAADTRTGQQIRAALWSLWDGASTFAFRDVDYGATAVERSVRMIGIREEWPKPADQSDLGADATLEVTLVEV